MPAAMSETVFLLHPIAESRCGGIGGMCQGGNSQEGVTF